MERFCSQADFARHRRVSRKTVTYWKQRGYVALRVDGLVDVGVSDARLLAAGIGNSSAGGGNRAGNNPFGTGARVGAPKGYRLVGQASNPVDQGAVGFGLDLFYSIGASTAALAVSCGASCQVALAISKAVRMAVMIELADYCRRYGVGPFETEEDPDVWEVDCIKPVNWEALAAIAGEPVDLPAWEQYARAKLSDDESSEASARKPTASRRSGMSAKENHHG